MRPADLVLRSIRPTTINSYLIEKVEIGFEADGHWEYFIVDKPFFEKKKKYRMVFCVDRNRPSITGIITFFQIKRGDK